MPAFSVPDLDATKFPAAYRRQTALTFASSSPRACSPPPSFTAWPGEASSLFRLHPHQNETTTQGAFALLDEMESLLRQISGGTAFVWGDQSPGEAVQRVFGLSQKWAEMRRLQARERRFILQTHAEQITGSPWLNYEKVGALETEEIKADFSRITLTQGAPLFVTVPACEVLGSELGSLLATSRALGSLRCLLDVDVTWLMHGFRPWELGFDAVILNLSVLLGAGENLYVLAVGPELLPFLPAPRWRHSEEGYRWQSPNPLALGESVEPWARFGAILSAYANLRMLGSEGLTELARGAVMRAAYLEKELRQRCASEQVVASLQEIFFLTGKKRRRLRGDETQEKLNAVVEEMCQSQTKLS